MRLRLTIQRHLLASVDILWSVDTSNPRATLTIAQLIEQVNEVVPLEHDQWGLEDYVTEVKGYECIHHFRVRDVLRDEDEVTIRPLEKHERRSRTRSGRTQISESGLHLIDGTPFGKQQQLSRRINRPLVRIPQPQPRPGLLLRNGSEEEAEEEEEEFAERIDSEFLSSDTNGHVHQLLDDNEHVDLRASKRKLIEFRKDEVPNVDDNGTLKKKRRSVKFDESSTPSRGNDSGTARFSEMDKGSDNDEDDEEPDDDFQPDSDKSDTDEVDEDDGAASGDNVSSSGSEGDSDETEGPSDSSSSSSSSYVSSSSSSSPSISSSSSVTSEVKNADETKNKKSLQKASPRCAPVPRKVDRLAASSTKSRPVRGTCKNGLVIPGKGLRKTVVRNRRRRDAKRLRYLKLKGTLSAEATLFDLKEFYDNLSKSEEQNMLSEKATDGNRMDNRPAVRNEQARPEVQDQGQKELDIPASKTISISFPSGSSPTVKDSDITPKTNTLQPNSSSPLSDHISRPAMRTSKLDVDSSRRMIFNSLGHRNPKNAADEERIRAKIVNSAKRNPINTSTEAQPANSKYLEQNTSNEYRKDPEYWKQKINLSAVECCDEGVELPEPPFPFKQRWYKQQLQQSAKGTLSAAGRKRKRKGPHSFDQTANGVNGDYMHTDRIMLNYDDDDQEAPTYINGNDGSLKENTITITDLPSLPEDPTSLPIPITKDLIPGAILAFKSLELSSATNWEPRISAYKVARLEDAEPSPASEREDEGQSRPCKLTLELAKRDSFPRKTVRFDDKGRRLYAKFEMEGYEEEVDDDVEDDEEEEEEEEEDGDFVDQEDAYEPGPLANGEGYHDDEDEGEEGIAATNTKPNQRGRRRTGRRRRSREQDKSERGKRMVVMRDELIDLRLLRAASASTNVSGSVDA